MSEEIQQAVQIIRVGYDGIEIAMKMGSASLSQMKNAVDFLLALLDREKSIGKTNIRKLLQKGGDLQVFQFDTEELRQVEKMAKKYGILYSVLPDINKADGKSEIIFHSEAVPRINMMMQKLKFGAIATFDDYLKNGEEKEMDQVLSFQKGQTRGKDSLHTAPAKQTGDLLAGLLEKVGHFVMEKASIRVEEIEETFGIETEQAKKIVGQLEKIGVISGEKEGLHTVLMQKEEFLKRMKGYQELAQRMQTVSAMQNPDVVDITITKKLIAEENDHAVKTRVPGTWGENARYLWVEKKKAMEIHEGKTILTFLDREKEYKMYSAENKIVATLSGSELYEKHYDSVAAEIRKRYQAAEKKAAQVKAKAPRPKRR